MASYFAPATDLGAISRYQLQDEAQNMAANADRRRFMADLQRISAQREQAQRDQAARMFQTQAYRDVGFNDAGVRRDIGLGEVGSRNKQIEATERIGMAPWERGVTPAQAQQFELDKNRLRIMEANPYLSANPQLQRDIFRQKQDQESIAKAAEAATARFQQAGGLNLQDELTDRMDNYGGGGWLPTFSGMYNTDARRIAGQLFRGEPVDSNFATREAVEEARKYMTKRTREILGPEFDEFLPFFKWDPVLKGFRSTYDTGTGAGLPQPRTTTAATPAAATAPQYSIFGTPIRTPAEPPLVTTPTNTVRGTLPTAAEATGSNIVRQRVRGPDGVMRLAPAGATSSPLITTNRIGQTQY